MIVPSNPPSETFRYRLRTKKLWTQKKGSTLARELTEYKYFGLVQLTIDKPTPLSTSKNLWKSRNTAEKQINNRCAFAPMTSLNLHLDGPQSVIEIPGSVSSWILRLNNYFFQKIRKGAGPREQRLEHPNLGPSIAWETISNHLYTRLSIRILSSYWSRSQDKRWRTGV